MQCLREQRPLDEDQVSHISWVFERRQALQSEVDALKRERRIHFGVSPDEDLPHDAEEDFGPYIRLRERVERLLNTKRITPRWVDIIHGGPDLTGPDLKELVEVFGLAGLALDPHLALSLTGGDWELSYAEAVVDAIEVAIKDHVYRLD